MSILDSNGRPVDPRANHTAPMVTVDGLPGWMHSAKYRSDDDIITMVIAVPASTHALAHLLALEMEPSSARAVVDVLSRLVAQSEALVLDASVSEPEE